MPDRYASLKQGLVGCWIPSISGSGLLLPDLSGRGNHGTLTNMGPEDWVSSGDGRALDFDGVNDFGSMLPLPYASDPAFTIHAWVQTTNASLAQTIFLTGNESFALGAIGLVVGTRGNGTAGVEFAGLTHYAVDGFAANRLHHIAAVKTPGPINTTTQVYIDGVLRPVIGTPTTSSPNLGSARATIGQFGLPANGWRFSGLIWEIGAYDRALSPAEIRLLASEPGIGFKPAKKLSRFSTRYTYKPPKAKVFEGVRVRDHDYASLRQGLVGAWCPSLPNGGSGNTLPDQSGRGNHGTLTNMGPEDWVSSGDGRALDFDGVDDEVVCRNVSIGGSRQLSVACWINRTGPNTGGLGNGVFAQWQNQGGNFGENQFVVLFVNNAIRANFVTTVANGLTANATIAENEWFHFAAIYDGSALTIFINGRFDSTLAASGAIANGTNNIKIGAYDSNLRSKCAVDDCRLYTKALAYAEIQLLASRPGIGLQPSRTRLIAREKKTGLRRKILTGQT